MNSNQKDYWNQLANDKEFTTPFQIKIFSQYVDKDNAILDIGCGYGRTLNELYSNGFNNLYGIDFSNKMIERGHNQYPWLNLKTQEDKTIPFENNSFDSVILLAVLTCVVNDSNQISLINEIKRVLKPNGVLYINDFLINSDEKNIERYNTYRDKYTQYGIFELPDGGVFRHHDFKWVESITSNFDTITLEKVVYTTMNGNKSNGFYYLGKNIK